MQMAEVSARPANQSGGTREANSTECERAFLVATRPAGPRERWRTYAALAFTLVVIGTVAPFATIPLPEVPEFTVIQGVSLALINVFTATLLMSQYRALRAPALLVLAGGYLFVTFMMIPYVLSFPGLFTAEGLLSSGKQTTSWLYRFWHCGFPVAVIGYALLKDRRQKNAFIDSLAWPAIIVTIAIVATIVVAIVVFVARGQGLLPAVIANNRYSAAGDAVNWGNLVLSLVPIVILWIRRPQTVLDLWLMVVMGAWLLETSLTGLFSDARFDLGWYSGRVFGLIAASALLIVLLSETGGLYVRFARTVANERNARERELRDAQEKLVHLSRVTELGGLLGVLASEVRKPLEIVHGYLRASDHLIQAGDTEKARAGLDQAAALSSRAIDTIDRIRGLMRKDETIQRNEDLAAAIDEVASFALVGTEGPTVTLELRLNPHCWLASIDKIRIQEVLLALIRNAVDAVRGCPERRIVVSSVPSGSDMIEVRVSDSGPGVSPEIRDKLFDPFVTTKPSGVGVGLAICRSIVEQHGGRMWLGESERGATFCFIVPRGKEEKSDIPASVRELLAPGRVRIISSTD